MNKIIAVFCFFPMHFMQAFVIQSGLEGDEAVEIRYAYSDGKQAAATAFGGGIQLSWRQAKRIIKMSLGVNIIDVR